MTPYYKLPSQWAAENKHIAIIGPDGLVKHKLCQTIQQQWPKHTVRKLSILDLDDIANLKNTLLSGSLFSEPELLFIRLSEKLISKFPWDIPHTNDKILIVYGIEKLPKTNILKSFDL